MTAFVLGNGCSRRAVANTWLAERGVVFGCNAIYREFAPHVLVATDTPISESIQNSGYSLQHTFYTRFPLPHLGALELPADYFRSSSGSNAVYLAATEFRTVYLLGFDMNAHSNKLNNLYAGTEFYSSSASYQPPPDSWLADLIKIAQTHSRTRFVRVVGPESASHPQYNALANVSIMPIASFLAQLS